MEPSRLETGPDRKRRRVVDEAVPAAVAADVVHVDPAPTPTPTPTPPAPDPASAAKPGWPWAGGGGFVHTNVQLGAEWRHTATPPTQAQADQIQADALAALGAKDPLLRHICTIKLVRNERKNFINVRIKKDHVPMVFRFRRGNTGCIYFFFVSVHVEPFIKVVPIHPARGAVIRWCDLNTTELLDAVAHFKRKYGVTGETYRYTEEGATAPTLQQVFDKVMKKTPLNFDLHIRIATQMFVMIMPIMKALSLDQTRAVVKTVEASPMNQVFREITQIDQILRHLVQNGRGAYPEFRLQFLSSVYAVWKNDLLYEFHLSDKFEPYAIAIVIDRNKGKLVRLSAAQLNDLENALDEFKKKYGIANEQYHYTPYAERAQTDAFVQGGGATMKSKAHSTDFHLKIRISSKMYTDRFPIFTSFDFGKIRREVEPVIYNFSRETVPWAQIKSVIMEEAVCN